MMRLSTYNHKKRGPLTVVARSLGILSCLTLLALAVTANADAGDVPHNTKTTTYEIQCGDSLYAIALRFDPDSDPRAVADWITEHNHLTDSDIQPGHALLVPIENK